MRPWSQGLSLVWMLAVLCTAGELEYSRRVWRVQDGLPQNKIQSISQTREGYLWIGTPGGLVRFDGVRFVTFDRSNTAEFRDDSVFSLCPSRDGTLWIGTEGGGLLHYAGGSFRTFGNRDGISNGFVRAMLEDRGGTLWVATDRGFFRKEGDRFKRLDGSPELPFVAGTSIEEDREGTIWVGSTHGLLSIDKGGRLVRTTYSQPVAALRLGHDGVLWVSAREGLVQWRDGAATVVRRWSHSVTRALWDDEDGNLWIGTFGEGLIRLNDGLVKTLGASAALPDGTVAMVFEDRERNLWFGTQDGLVRLSKTSVNTLTRRDGLNDENVYTVGEDRAGNFWVATITGQLYRGRNGSLKPFHLPAPATDFRARSVFLDSKGVLWIGTAGQGLVRLADGRATVFTTKDGLMSESVRQIHEDRSGRIWIATGSGLSHWDGQRMRTLYVNDGLAYGGVRVIAEDRDGDLLVGTDGGISRIHQSRIVRDPVFAQLGNERIWSIHIDSDHGLWLGSRGGGLFRIRDGKLFRFTKREGLPANAIYQILEDDNHRLWMSSPSGVFSVERRELDAIAGGRPGPAAVLSFGIAEGLESNQMNGGVQPAGWRAASGDLWFPSVKGAVRIRPNQPRFQQPAAVLVESVSVDDRPLPLSSKVVIPEGRGKLEIHFTACSLLSPDRVSFRYRLEGLEDSWSNATSNRTAYYTNLAPGSYRFHVVATDGGSPGTTDAVLPFEWKPHVYQTRWFYALCALLVAAGVWAALRFYARQTKARYAMLLAERTRLARDMHDTVIQGCVGVSTLLEAASTLRDLNGDSAHDMIDRARVQVKLTLDEARQAVWDLRHETLDSRGVVDRLVEFGDRVSAEKAIRVHTEVDGALTPLDEKTGRNLLLVAREAISNAAVHARPSQIEVRLRFGSAGASLEVSDDGCGFETTDTRDGSDGHFGLVGMRERIEQLGGSLRLVSSPGRGTRVIAELPARGVSR